MEGNPSTPPLPPITSRETRPIGTPRQPQSSRRFSDWVILVAAFIFLVIISHAANRTVEELQKLTAALKLAAPQTDTGGSSSSPLPYPSPPPYPGGVPYPPPSPPTYPSSTSRPRYEYLVLVEMFADSYDYRVGTPRYEMRYTDYLNTKSAEGWELLQSYVEVGDQVNLIFYRPL